MLLCSLHQRLLTPASPSGAAWALVTNDSRNNDQKDINIVQRWPHGGDELKVPSKYTYTSNSGSKWGHNIGQRAYVLERTKLDLQPPSLQQALKILKDALQAPRFLRVDPNRGNVIRHPVAGHVMATPAETVTHFLYEVAKIVRQDIVSSKDAMNLENWPIDLVITHPGVRRVTLTRPLC
jgi:hypothetical protein